MQKQKLKQHQTIFKAGDAAGTVFLIVRGSVGIFLPTNDTKEPDFIIGENEIFGDKGKYYPNRIKQWCGYLKRQYPEAEVLFNDIRRLTKSQDIVDVLARQADI